VLLVITKEKRRCAVVLVCVLLLLPARCQKVKERMEVSTQSIVVKKRFDRGLLWLEALNVLKEPKGFILGIGMGDGFEDRYYGPEGRYGATDKIGGIDHPHNLFLYHLVWAGVIGLLGFLYLLWGIFLNFRSLLRRCIEPRMRWMVGALMASVTGTLLHGLADCTLYSRGMLILFLSIIAIGASKFHCQDVSIPAGNE